METPSNVGSIAGIVLVGILFLFLLLFLIPLLIFIFRKRPPLNLACTTNTECGSDATCVSGVCKSNAGGPCTTASDCALTNSVCLGGKCITIIPPPVPPSSSSVSASPTPSIIFSGSVPTFSAPRTTTWSVPTSSMRLGMVSERTDGGLTIPTQNTIDLVSMPTEYERTQGFHTPSTEGNQENPFFEASHGMICRNDLKRSPVIDVTSYSDSILALLENGMILREITHPPADEGFVSFQEKRCRVSNNVRLNRLEAFQGILYGLSVEGRLFSLRNDTFSTRKWMWDGCPWAPSGLIHTSATLDGNHFWAQTETQGYLFGSNGVLQEEMPLKHPQKRVYGLDRSTYVEIDSVSQEATVYPSRRTLKNIVSAVLNYHHELTVLRTDQQHLFTDLRLVHWTPYFIRRNIPE